MDIVVSNEGERELLRCTLRKSTADPDPWRLHLFQNDFTPTRDVILADLEECDVPGYAPADLDPESWTEPATVDGGAESWYGSGTLTVTSTGGAQWQYGFFVTDFSDTVLLWCARFDSPQFFLPGAPVVVQLGLGGRSQSEPT